MPPALVPSALGHTAIRSPSAMRRGSAMSTQNDEVLARLATIEAMLATLVEQRTVKEWYSTAEVAAALGKAEFTVREWCRLGRVKAEKKKSGRGPASEWMISHAELTRVRNEGLLPDTRVYRTAT